MLDAGPAMIDQLINWSGLIMDDHTAHTYNAAHTHASSQTRGRHDCRAKRKSPPSHPPSNDQLVIMHHRSVDQHHVDFLQITTFYAVTYILLLILHVLLHTKRICVTWFYVAECVHFCELSQCLINKKRKSDSSYLLMIYSRDATLYISSDEGRLLLSSETLLQFLCNTTSYTG